MSAEEGVLVTAGPEQPEGCPAQVLIRDGNRRYHANYRAGDTLLHTARRNKVAIPSNCEYGDCGTCLVRLLEGRVRMYRNNVLSDADLQAGDVLACQGVPCSTVCIISLY